MELVRRMQEILFKDLALSMTILSNVNAFFVVV